MLLKNIQINNKNNLDFCIISNKFYLKKKDSNQFLNIPNEISIRLTKKVLEIKTLENNFLIYNKFCTEINLFLKDFNRIFIKKLILKGLGLKVNLLNKLSLQLKLGFSHLVDIVIPNNLIVSFSKSIIAIQGTDATAVGNFANLVKRKKLPDAYKGKGIWYKNEKLILKTVKKT